MTEETAFDEFPAYSPSRALWLMTLADLALLLVGFFVLLQTNQQLDPHKLAEGLREGFGGAATPAPMRTAAPAMPLAANIMPGFAPGSAMLPAAPSALITWAGEAARDPRVALTVTGSTDGTTADADPTTGSAAVLAADRARAVAAALGTVAPGRILIATTNRPGHRQVTVTLAFAGEGNPQ